MSGSNIQQKYSLENNINNPAPSANDFLQIEEQTESSQQVQEKFIGNALWAVFDVITFGAFETKDRKKKKREEAQRAQQE